MIRIFLLALVLISSTMGCSSKTAYSNVRNLFPTAEIAQVPGNKYAWIVRTESDDIFWVNDNGITPFTAAGAQTYLRPISLFPRKNYHETPLFPPTHPAPERADPPYN